MTRDIATDPRKGDVVMRNGKKMVVKYVGSSQIEYETACLDGVGKETFFIPFGHWVLLVNQKEEEENGA